MKKILVIPLLIALLTACSQNIATAEPSTPAVNVSDPAKILEAAAGNEFKIVIDSNPTTGYH